MPDHIYSMKITLKGEPRVLTIRVGDKGTDVLLTDGKGKTIEYFKQEGSKVTITKPKKKKAA
ncbi:MAG: hypothetical protein AABW86_02075 [Candidatus Micrarchaeota archaeon]|nr:hypothetical protein [Candidatus Micrarchaeota archaeon]